MIAGAQLGVALQWAGLPVDAQRAWLAAAECRSRTTRTSSACRRGRSSGPGDLKRRARTRVCRCREGAGGRRRVCAARRAHVPGDQRDPPRPAARGQGSASALEQAAGTEATGMRLEALGVRAWVEALLGNVEACRASWRGGRRSRRDLGVTIWGGMAAGLLDLSLGRYDDAVQQLEAKRTGGVPRRGCSFAAAVPGCAGRSVRQVGSCRSGCGARCGRGVRRGNRDDAATFRGRRTPDARTDDERSGRRSRPRSTSTGAGATSSRRHERGSSTARRFGGERQRVAAQEQLAAASLRLRRRRSAGLGTPGEGRAPRRRRAPSSRCVEHAADAAGGARRRARRRGAVEQGDRSAPRREHEDGRGPSPQHLREARSDVPHAGRASP